MHLVVVKQADLDVLLIVILNDVAIRQHVGLARHLDDHARAGFLDQAAPRAA